MKFGSLFSGIGGFDLGFERAEMIGCESIRAQVEGYIKHYGQQEMWL